MRILPILLSLAAYSTSTFSFAANTQDHPLPTAEERLPSARPLSCGGTVVEWKGTSLFPETFPSDEGFKELDRLCTLALQKYPKFLMERKRVDIASQVKNVNINISLLPGNVKVDGKNTRNLNDVAHRFSTSGQSCCFWGLYINNLQSLFVRNDPVSRRNGKFVSNKFFDRTFLHEMVHVLNHQWSLRGKYVSDKDSDDELLAEEFVTWLGFRFKTESSGDDLSNKLYAKALESK